MIIIFITFAILVFGTAIKELHSKEKTKKIPENKFDVGDKVGFSDNILDDFKGKKEFYSKHVFEVIGIYESEDFDMFSKGITIRGVKVLKLNCGTTMYDFEAKKLPKDTPLFH